MEKTQTDTSVFRDRIAAWLAVTRTADPVLGLDEKEAGQRAADLFRAILENSISPDSIVLDEEMKQVLSVLVRQIADSIADPDQKLHDAEAVYQFVRRLVWPNDGFGEQRDLLLECAQIGWGALGISLDQINHRRIAGRAIDPIADSKFRRPGPWCEHRLSSEEGWQAAERVLATPISGRTDRARELPMEDAELLLCVCGVLRSRLEGSPMNVRAEAEFFYQFLEQPKRKIGLFDEREYYLGELALLAGTACRLLFHRDEARAWFNRAEARFTLAANGLAHVARLGHQRLALAAEERNFQQVFELAPLWSESFAQQGLDEDALKCRFLEGVSYWETGQPDLAIAVHKEICAAAEAGRHVRLTAQAANNLVHYYSSLGQEEQALAYSCKALPLLKQLDSRVHLAKLQWSIGDLLRNQGKLGEAIAAYREALDSARDVGIRGDQVALHLVLADVLLDAGQDRQAEWEVRAALPIIDEEKMVPEGYAALAFLRDALRLRQVDRKALRELHGYFRDQR